MKLPWHMWIDIYCMRLRSYYFHYVHFPIKFFIHKATGHQTWWYEEYWRTHKLLKEKYK